MSEQYDKINHWYGWNGGECPVHPETKIEAAFAGVESTSGRADTFYWRHNGDLKNDIIAFRIIKPYVAPRVAREFDLSFDVRGNVSIVGHYQYKANETIRAREVLPEADDA